jgi:acetyl esterase/lipase
MKTNLAAGLAFALSLLLRFDSAFAADSPEVISLWPKDAPGEQGNMGEEKDTTTAKDGLVAGKPVVRLGNVSHPTLTIFRPPKDKDTGTAVLVCPGGGYHILAMDLEGTEVCEWLNSIGVTGALLKYRVPARAGQERHAAPLQDAQRALGILRQRAKDWNLEPKQIGILGFSAGGHLAATASTNFEKRNYEPLDAADELSCRPDFVILIYPAYLTVKNDPGKLAPELNVSAKTPPTFIAQTQDDSVGVENSEVYAMALQKAKVPTELHVYPSGGHGYGLRASEKTVTTWPKRAEEWMRAAGWLPGK